MGRRKSLVFDHWRKQPGDKVSCRYCSHTISTNSTRMVVHLQRDCQKVPVNVRQHFQSNSSYQSPNITPDVFCPRRVSIRPPISIIDIDSSPPTSSPLKKQRSDDVTLGVDKDNTVTTMTPSIPPIRTPMTTPTRLTSSQFVDTINAANVANANKRLAALIYASNLPFSLVDDPKFRAFVGALRPAYEKQMPHKKTVSRKDNAYYL